MHCGNGAADRWRDAVARAVPATIQEMVLLPVNTVSADPAPGADRGEHTEASVPVWWDGERCRVGICCRFSGRFQAAALQVLFPPSPWDLPGENAAPATGISRSSDLVLELTNAIAGSAVRTLGLLEYRIGLPELGNGDGVAATARDHVTSVAFDVESARVTVSVFAYPTR